MSFGLELALNFFFFFQLSERHLPSILFCFVLLITSQKGFRGKTPNQTQTNNNTSQFTLYRDEERESRLQEINLHDLLTVMPLA